MRPMKLSNDTIFLISYPGEIFMRILKLMILPLLIASLVTGSSSIKMNKKIALRTFLFFTSTSMFNAVLGVILALLINPGDQRLNLAATNHTKTSNLMDGILDLGR